MGLDMYAFTKVNHADQNPVEFHYWRKHPNLHGWMEKLYIQQGGTEEFNCLPLELKSADLDQLETDLKNASLPHTGGFFFGSSCGDETEDDLEFIQKARKALSDGLIVFYYSWW